MGFIKILAQQCTVSGIIDKGMKIRTYYLNTEYIVAIAENKKIIHKDGEIIKIGNTYYTSLFLPKSTDPESITDSM